ncbi:MAG: hypothetical protein H7246_05075 [Phycisphaerae bacterium]|nr:hypothetical protein [Saprospiraceae bacterium]
MSPKWVVLLLLYCSCQNGLSPDQYQKWLTAHFKELSSSQQQNGINATLTWLPADGLAIKEVGTQDKTALAAARKEYEGLEYYRLRIALQSGQGDVLQFQAANTDEYYQRVEYFSFGMQHDLSLLAGTDTLPCKLFHFERNYGAAPYADFMLGFEEKPENKSDRTLLYLDRVFSDTLIRLTIDKEKFQGVPVLEF